MAEHEVGVENLANYVLSLPGAAHDAAKADAGKAMFTVCAACHSADAKAIRPLARPNLTDTTWLYGGDLVSVAKSIHGGTMPSWHARLGESDARVSALAQ